MQDDTEMVGANRRSAAFLLSFARNARWSVFAVRRGQILRNRLAIDFLGELKMRAVSRVIGFGAMARAAQPGSEDVCFRTRRTRRFCWRSIVSRSTIAARCNRSPRRSPENTRLHDREGTGQSTVRGAYAGPEAQGGGVPEGPPQFLLELCCRVFRTGSVS